MKLHNYQHRMVQHILDSPKCGIFAEPGLGKTVTVLEAIANLPKPVLIVAPLRVCHTVWAQEAVKWGYDYKIVKILGTANHRKAAANAEADVFIINIENFSKLRYAYQGSWKWPTVVFDESSLLKSPGSKRTKAAHWVSKRATNVILLTGTPAPKSLLDLYAQIKCLDEGQRLGRSIAAYKRNHFYPTDWMKYNWAVVPGREKVIEKLISDICISLSADDYLSLPDRIVNDIRVTLPPVVQCDYDTLVEEMYLEIGDTEIDAVSAGVLVNKLAQFASGAVYAPGQDYAWLHNAKIEALDDIIEEAAGQPVLIVYNYKHSLARLRDAIPTLVELRDDDTVVDRWNNKEIGVMAMHPASGGHGLNLQAGGHIMVWFDMTWNLEHYQQSNARLHRQGQGHPVMIHRLIAADTVDEQIAERLETKATVQQTLMEALK